VVVSTSLPTATTITAPGAALPVSITTWPAPTSTTPLDRIETGTGVAVGRSVNVAVGVEGAVAVGISVGVAVGVNVSVAVDVTVAVGVCVGVGVGGGSTTTYDASRA
jgi:hypothetical protein